MKMKPVRRLLAAMFAALLASPAMAEKVLDTDVVVIGAGAAGTAASFAGAEAGAKVIVLEKQATTGGTASSPKASSPLKARCSAR